MSADLLYIVPVNPPTAQPHIDQLTRKMTAAFRNAVVTGPRYASHHTCCCGAHSDNTNYLLTSGLRTNSLCLHYLAYHRQEVPESQLKMVQALQCGEEDPSELELSSPYLMSPSASKTAP